MKSVKTKKKMNRALALLMCACLILAELNGLGSFAMVANAVEDVPLGICEHHKEHDEECGYVEAVEGQPCTHEHDEECGYVEGSEASECTHVHDEGCYGLACVHVHDESCYADGTVPGEDAPENNGDGMEPGGDASESNGEVDLPSEDVPENNGEVDLPGGDASENNGDGIMPESNGESIPSDINTLAANNVLLDEGALVADACQHEHGEECYELICEHEHDEECGYIEEQPCTHEHDEDCGYVEEVEGHDCEFVCETCDFIVTNWTWAEQSEMLSPASYYGFQNVGWVLNLTDLGADEITAEALEFLLPAEITATTPRGYVMSLPIAWDFENPVEYVPSMDGSDDEMPSYQVYAATLPEGYVLGEDAADFSVLVLTAEEEDDALLDEQGAGVPMLAAEPAKIEKYGWDAALHFFIRHWHSSEVSDGLRFQNGSQESQVGGRHFVIAEGYIVPLPDGSFEFWFVNQDDNKLVKINPDEAVEASAYIERIEPSTGTIVLKANPVMKDEDTPLESFSGFSISAGHSAVTEGTDDITIKYDWYVHLVKGHVFYISELMEVNGTNDETVFGASGLTGSNPEVDTLWAYTYTELPEDSEHKVGDIVKFEGKPVTDKITLWNVLQWGEDAVLTKFYSTNEGLHTDKTASVADPDGGRTFNLDLEAWYTEGYASQVAMILDASGSMAFASDEPKAINVNDLKPDQRAQLAEKIGALQKQTSKSVYPQRDQMIGYYPFALEGTTYTLDANKLDLVSTGTKADGDTTVGGTKDFFTVIWASSSGLGTCDYNYDIEHFPDGGGYKTKKRINFGCGASTGRGSIKFTTTGPASVKIWWAVGGSRADKNPQERELAILNGNGDVVTATTNGTGNMAATKVLSTLELSEAGTYYLGGYNASSYICKVEVLIHDTDSVLRNGVNGNHAKLVDQATDASIAFGENESAVRPTTNNGRLVVDGKSSSGIMLDAIPNSGEFTISFTINKDSSGDVGTGVVQNPADILYVGALNPSGENYLRVVREGRDSATGPYGSVRRAWLAGYQGNPDDGINTPAYDSTSALPKTVVSATSAFHTGNPYYITYVYKDRKLTTYLNGGTKLNITNNPGDVSQENELMLEDGFRIILNAFNTGYNGASIYVDDVFVYNVALEKDEVQDLYDAITSGRGIDETVLEVNWEEVFLTPREVSLLLNPHNSDNSRLGESDYTYFVYDPEKNTYEYVPLGYWEGNDVKLTGYYEFAKHQINKDDERTWLLNTIAGGNPSDYDYKKLDENHFAKMVLWNETGDTYDFTNQQMLYTSEKYGGWGSTPLRFIENEGVRLEMSEAALLLTPSVTGKDLTVSFSIKRSGDADDMTNIAEILFVGGEQGRKDAKNFFRMYREGANLKISVGMEEVETIAGVFENAGVSQYVTAVFEGDADSENTSVSIYLNGTKKASVNLSLGGRNVVFSPFKDEYDLGGDTKSSLCANNIFLFDNALSASQVKTLATFAASGDGLDKLALSSTTARTSEGNVIGQLGNIGYTEAGWYYINHSSDWGTNYVEKDLQSGKVLVGVAPQGIKEDGVKAEDDVFKDDIPVPNKMQKGLDYDGTQAIYKPEVHAPVRFYIDSKGYLRCFFSRSEYKTETVNGVKVTAPTKFTSYVYELADNEYIKAESLQRALGAFVTQLNESSPSSQVSAVRFSTDKLPDKDLPMQLLLDWTNDASESASILSLKRGVGGTVTGTESITNQLMQYNYGLTGGTHTNKGLRAFIENLLEFDSKHDGVKENDDGARYLIIFTDGKDTDLTNLKDGQKLSDLDAVKYAQQLKRDGYTIFTVMLTGGPVTIGSESYDSTKEFLVELSGTAETDGLEPKRLDPSRLEEYQYETPTYSEDKGEYFFSTDEALMAKRNEISEELFDGAIYDELEDEEQDAVNEKIKARGITTEDLLTDIFLTEILSRIVGILDGYTVTDYIDPRFDLMAHAVVETGDPENPVVPSEEEYVLHLNAKGNVIVALPTGDPKKPEQIVDQYNLENGYLPIFLTNKETDEDARQPLLRYDKKNDMYYLDWVNQTIPSGSIDTTRLSVWNARIKVKAKDDFIGGNAILSNGNLANMNWVYHPNDLPGSEVDKDEDGIPFKHDASSGTDDMMKEYETKKEGNYESRDFDKPIDGYPSKGFPRTTVNVKLLPLGISEFEKILYLGEEIEPAKLVEELGKSVTNLYYWKEYLERYGNMLATNQAVADRFKSLGYDVTNQNSGKLVTNYEELLKYLLEYTNDEPLVLPYAYLPNVDGTNQAGQKDGQQQDIIGELRYMWQRLDPDTGEIIKDNEYGSDGSYETNIGPLKAEKYQVMDTRTVQYRLIVTYYPYPDPDNLEATDIALGKYKADLFNAQYDLEKKEEELAPKYEALNEAKQDLEDLENQAGDPDEQKKAELEQQIERLEKQVAELEGQRAVYADKVQSLTEEKGYLEAYKNWISQNKQGATTPAPDPADGTTPAPITNEAGRTVENGALVDEQDSKGKDVYPTRDGSEEKDNPYPKKAVGEAQLNKTVNGKHTTKVVRGELAFEMCLQMADLDYLFANSWKGKTSVSYTVNVKRKDSEGTDMTWTPEIKPLKIEISKDDLAKLKEYAQSSADGTAILYYTYEEDGHTIDTYPKAVYDRRSDEVIFYTDPRVWDPPYNDPNIVSSNTYARQLPIGNYEMTPDAKTNKDDWYMFDLKLEYAPREDYVREKNHFTDSNEPANSKDSVYYPIITREVPLMDGQGQPVLDENGNPMMTTVEFDPDYCAIKMSGTDGVDFRLGTDKTPGANYLAQRVGMAKITLTVNDLPATGGPGTDVFRIAGLLLLMVAAALYARSKWRRRYT